MPVHRIAARHGDRARSCGEGLLPGADSGAPAGRAEKELAMGYFDRLTSSYFRTGRDGRRLFYPRGAMGRGYVVPTEDEYQRLHGIAKIFTAAFHLLTCASLVLIVVAVALQMPVAGVVVATVVVAAVGALCYELWARALTRRLAPSSEKLSIRSALSTQAFAHNGAKLWLLEFLSLGFVAAGVFMLVRDSGNWPIALASIVFFGLCAGVLAFMLAVRRERVTP
jgi:hypothetical protein